MRITTPLLCSLLLAVSVSAQDTGNTQPPSDRANFHLYLLVGQSNMAGRGKVTDADRQPDPNILMLNQTNQWVPAVDPLHFDKPKLIGVGLGRSFARDVAKATPGVTIGLIPCAVGGSPIASWEAGGEHKSTKTHPYDDMLVRLRVALKSGNVKGILWHQGESDSKPVLSAKYEARLHDLIQRIRTEAGGQEIPFIAGQLGQFEERPWNESRQRVSAAHESLPSKVAHTAFVSSAGLGHKGDEVHFNADRLSRTRQTLRQEILGVGRTTRVGRINQVAMLLISRDAAVIGWLVQ